MPFDPTILKQKIDGLKEAFLNGNFGDALVSAINTGNGLMQQRIFGNNTDVNGRDFGQYIGAKKKLSEAQLKEKISSTKSQTDRKRIRANADIPLTSYQRKRVNKGRQIAKKDLEFTGGLRRSIETQIANEKSAVIQFSTDEAAMIAKGQEQQIADIRVGIKANTKRSGVPKIFALSPEEKQEVVSQGAELIKIILKPK